MFGLIGNLGPWELVLILVIVLIIVGPGSSPKLGNPWGKPYRASAKPKKMSLMNWKKRKKSRPGLTSDLFFTWGRTGCG